MKTADGHEISGQLSLWWGGQMSNAEIGEDYELPCEVFGEVVESRMYPGYFVFDTPEGRFPEAEIFVDKEAAIDNFANRCCDQLQLIERERRIVQRLLNTVEKL